MPSGRADMDIKVQGTNTMGILWKKEREPGET
jgi:hypothetical protein